MDDKDFNRENKLFNNLIKRHLIKETNILNRQLFEELSEEFPEYFQEYTEEPYKCHEDALIEKYGYEKLMQILGEDFIDFGIVEITLNKLGEDLLENYDFDESIGEIFGPFLITSKFGKEIFEKFRDGELTRTNVEKLKLIDISSLNDYYSFEELLCDAIDYYLYEKYGDEEDIDNLNYAYTEWLREDQRKEYLL